MEVAFRNAGWTRQLGLSYWRVFVLPAPEIIGGAASKCTLVPCCIRVIEAYRDTILIVVITTRGAILRSRV